MVKHAFRGTTPDLEGPSSSAAGSPKIFIAGIDNGLAFPFKHPDNWRSYPFGWTYLPAAKLPFSEEVCSTFLPVLSNAQWISELVSDLRRVFEVDADFNEHLFARQIAVLRGQIFNLIECLKARRTPLDLVSMPPIEIESRLGESGPTTSISSSTQAALSWA